MNERIFKIALEAFQPINDIASEGIADRRTFDQAWFQSYNQKFALLIVKVCLGKIENEAAQYHEPTWAFELTQDIKEHFGVEE